jgi:hypothetical protein
VTHCQRRVSEKVLHMLIFRVLQLSSPEILQSRDIVLRKVIKRANSQSLSHLIPLKSSVKLKYTLVQTRRLCTGRTARRGNRGIAVLFHDQRH